MLSSYDSPDTLFIVVYEGHSDADYRQTIASLISVPWSFVEAELATVKGDVLMLFDSCFSSRATMGYENFEYLAASAFESPAAASIDMSFTRRIIDLLSQVDTELTVSQIHAELVQHANRPGSQLDYTPVHVAAKDKPSVTIRRLEALPRELRGLRRTAELGDGKALVTVRITGKTSVPDIGQWIKWLSTSIPEDVADIKLEGVFESDSSLCLLTMPTAVWNMVRHNESFEFVSFVQSGNLLDRYSTNAPPALESRPGGIEMPYRSKD
ncbi:hypothetical protein BO78DRAFT_460749 [Aspergillus sclerotiicarbonarius CBS 121057]|uniref:Uncharacterized protein n=1 Tax=Aspergillus sclerotiicarbonarius (strain CBS 121057 / IBT 28362) TaxID=1448318 RepID=A0A319EKE6_ASPSB|nr:hypothetical protein BO78DRAFT_460749 [Aspergillus sclerotiicarbonarius CBS 121057]